MKILNLTEFRKQPQGTLFSKYEPCAFDDLCIKGETLDCDFLYQDIVGAIDAKNDDEFQNKLHLSEALGNSIKMDFDCQSRDGCFEDGQLFAVWEISDVEALIIKLQKAIQDSAAKP